uniref:Saccharopine dehydrogenase NADP binding domain-containing protein n=1 Tax=Lotharella oceanica TaxID=641309 RepID=A0A7S2TZH4_9EUKA
MDSKTEDMFSAKFKELGKRRIMTGWKPLVPFLFMACVVLPLFLFAILPSTIIFVVLGLLSGKKKAPKPQFFDEEGKEGKERVKEGLTKREDREFELVLYGATGFTGRLAARYAAKQYAGKGLRWAIAGRNAKKLEKVASELKSIDPKLEVKMIIADSRDSKALESMVRRTMVVATAVGPFAKYGNKLVAMCAVCGTDYVDTTGEAGWVQHIIADLHPTAKKSGARIVPFSAHDCVPWDMVVQQMAIRLQEKHGQDLKKVEIVDDTRGKLSGGTVDTIFNIIQNPLPRPRWNKNFNPWLLDMEGKKGKYKVKFNSPKLPSWSNVSNEWQGLFLMADMNAKLVQRSNVLNKYGKSISYSEGMSHDSFMRAFVITLGTILLAVSAFNPILGYFMRKFVLPKPGEGATDEEMERGYLKVTGVGTGEKGAKVYTTLGFFKDAGYMDTGRMLIECGLTLALEDKSKLKHSEGGVWTSASCMGPVLLERLVATGCTFDIHS